LNALAERLVVGARAILRQGARLPVDLDRASALIFERRDHVALVVALEHPLVARPIEKDRLQVFGVGCRCVGLGHLARRWSLRTSYQWGREHEDGCERAPGPFDCLTSVHTALP
jgi:hypothetical protein